MKKALLIIAAVIFSGQLFAQGIDFEHGTWAEAKAKAKAENKLIFVDVYTDWCGPCMRMAASVFKDSKVGEYMNSNFISLKIDAEKGEGVDFAKEYEAKAFPTLLFINGDGEVVYKSVGGKNSEEFIAMVKTALDPAKQLSSLEKLYNQGNRDKKTVLAYIAALKEAYKDHTKVVAEYLNEIGEKKWDSKVVYEIVSKYLDDYKLPAFEYFVKNKTTYEKHASKADIDLAIFTVFKMNFIKRFNTEGKEIVDEIKEAAKITGETMHTHISNYFATALGNDWGKEDFRKIADSNIMAYSTAWEIDKYINIMLYEKNPADIPEELKYAAKWCKRGIELEDNITWHAKYIDILIKQGKNAEARKLLLELLPKADKEIEASSNKANAMVTCARAFIRGDLGKIPEAGQKAEEWIKEAIKSDDSFINNTILFSALSVNEKQDELKKAYEKLEKMAKNDMAKNYVKSLYTYVNGTNK
ncbi:thioredoxin family protein [Saccharicrinis sp. GN24d3]|uniref:thioredoxin family protein n=1 Tax=Saccharicrinis sp. GN24d3 TaxID=3458416 RepID=UPI0040371C1E